MLQYTMFHSPNETRRNLGNITHFNETWMHVMCVCAFHTSRTSDSATDETATDLSHFVPSLALFGFCLSPHSRFLPQWRLESPPPRIVLNPRGLVKTPECVSFQQRCVVRERPCGASNGIAPTPVKCRGHARHEGKNKEEE